MLINGNLRVPSPKSWPTRMDLRALRQAALDDSYVSMGSRRTSTVHEFYRYPARFPPALASAAITAFTELGDVVCDPMVGGGTTMVEARIAGRRAIGADISPLATFITRAKARPYAQAVGDAVKRWGDDLNQTLNIHAPFPELHSRWEDGDYLRQLRRPDTWRIGKLIAQALDSLRTLTPGPQRDLARIAILRTAQWALDMRRELPSVNSFRQQLTTDVTAMVDVAREYAQQVAMVDACWGCDGERSEVVLQGLPGLANHEWFEGRSAHMVLFSPPYPGVYVLYHRWKLQGRKEIPAPFWIANCLDGRGHSHYTMNARPSTLSDYFLRMGQALQDVGRITRQGGWLVQIVGFRDPASQLYQYLKATNAAGFDEVLFPELATSPDGRLWRPVPSRRWWVKARAREATAPHTAQEVVLIHRRR